MNEGNMAEMMQNLNKMMNGKEMPENVKTMFQNMINSSSSLNDNQKSTTDTHDSDFKAHTNYHNSTTDAQFSSFQHPEKENSQESAGEENPFSNIDMGTIMKMKNIMDKLNSKKNDPRSNLLLSLKPYLKPSRKEKVDQYIQLFAMTDVLESLNMSGGDNKK